MIRPRRGLAALCLLALVGCEGFFVEPPLDLEADGPTTLRIAYASDASAASAVISEVFDQVDQIVVRVLDRSNAVTLFDGPVHFEQTAGGAAMDLLDIDLPVEASLLIEVDLLWSEESLFFGSVEVGVTPSRLPEVPTIIVDAVPESVVIEPIPTFDRLGVTFQAGAEARFATGHAIPGAPLVWSSSRPDIVSVDEGTGVLEVLAEGQAELVAAYRDMSTSAPVGVAVPVARVVMNPSPSVDLAQGESLTFTAFALSENGEVLPRTIEWSSTDPAVATVDASGHAQALATGTTTIIARGGGQSATALLRVLGPELGLTTSAATEVGTTSATLGGALSQSGAVGVWFEYDVVEQPGAFASRTATMTPGPDGSFSATLAGLQTDTEYFFRAAADLGADTIHGSVRSFTTATPTVPAVVLVSPLNPRVQAGDTVAFSAIALDGSGDALSGTASWTSSDPTVATITADGTVIALRDGTTQIQAEIGGVVGVSQLTVGPELLVQIVVTPLTGSIQIGGSVTFAAVGLSASGDTLSMTFTWTSSNPLVASVSSLGEALAIGPGVATIRASAGGVSGSGQLAVSTLPVTQVVVTPATTSAQPGDTVIHSAVALDALGDTVSAVFTWTSSNPVVANVNGNGVAVALGPGVTEIRATAGGVTGSGQLTVGLSAYGRIEALIADLDAAASASNGDEREAIEEVIGRLNQALAELNDGPPPHFEHALVDMRNAAGDLEDAIDKGDIGSAQGTAWAIELVSIGRQMVVIGIADAGAAGGNPVKILQAQAELAAGDALAGLGQHKNALNAYKNAMGDAVSALP